MTVRILRLWALLFVGLAASLNAAPQSALKLPVAATDKLLPQAAFVAALLKAGGSVYFRLPADALPSRDTNGQWRREALQAALRSQGALVLSGNIDGAGKGLNVDLAPVDEQEGPWLAAAGIPNITLIENSSTVSPLSKGLQAWNWPYKVLSFAQVEADPSVALDARRSDMVVFSSPGWWNDDVNPPSGPSGMSKSVADALREFVRQGGTALFVDIAQWDLEKAWPKTLNLSPLGPYGVSKLTLEGGPTGGVSLAPVGVATDRLRAKNAFGLLGSPKFAFPDGVTRELFAAYAMPDPGQGQGWVGGLALHVFEQDEGLAARVRRLFLNLILLSGARRLSVPGEARAAAPPTAPVTVAPTATLLPTATLGPVATLAALIATPVPPKPTAIPAVPLTVWPTQAPTLYLSPRPTPKLVPPTPWPTPTFRPTPVFKAPLLPTPLPTRVPTHVPTPRPASSPLPTAIPPTRVPSPLATRAPGPEVKTEAGIKNSLGCLESAPEPFGDGGVYLQFCLKRTATYLVSVYDAQGGLLWHCPPATVGAGNHQVFFDGRVHGRQIVAGRYLWEIRAEYAPGQAESRQGNLTRGRP